MLPYGARDIGIQVDHPPVCIPEQCQGKHRLADGARLEQHIRTDRKAPGETAGAGAIGLDKILSGDGDAHAVSRSPADPGEPVRFNAVKPFHIHPSGPGRPS